MPKKPLFGQSKVIVWLVAFGQVSAISTAAIVKHVASMDRTNAQDGLL